MHRALPHRMIHRRSPPGARMISMTRTVLLAAAALPLAATAGATEYSFVKIAGPGAPIAGAPSEEPSINDAGKVAFLFSGIVVGDGTETSIGDYAVIVPQPGQPTLFNL